jgi:hypothetical protein
MLLLVLICVIVVDLQEVPDLHVNILPHSLLEDANTPSAALRYDRCSLRDGALMPIRADHAAGSCSSNNI